GILKRSQVGLLHHVIRVFVVTHQPARQVVGGIEMRKKEISQPANLSPHWYWLAHRHVLLRMSVHVRDSGRCTSTVRLATDAGNGIAILRSWSRRPSPR